MAKKTIDVGTYEDAERRGRELAATHVVTPHPRTDVECIAILPAFFDDFIFRVG